jgi:hypothetical protein
MRTLSVCAIRWVSVLALVLSVTWVSCGDDDPASPGNTGPTGLTFNNFQDAAVVIGQADKNSGDPNAGATTGPVGLNSPFGSPGGQLYVPDRLNNRVLGFNSIPTADGEAADFVLGQANFTSNGSGTTAQNFNSPMDCVVSGGKLFMVDSGNDRVLIWNTLPTANDPADVVVGHADFTSGAGSTTQGGLSLPVRLAIAGGKLFVVDQGSNRVMIWNTIPTTNGALASVVVGQANFTTATSGLSASKFDIPRGIWTDGVRLVIGDAGNLRVLIWNSIPTTNGETADVVVGAPNFTTAGSTTASATATSQPWGVASDGTSLFVCSTYFSRVSIFRPFPTTNGAAAVGVLGQSNFTNDTENDANQDGVNDGAPTARTLYYPTGIRVINNRLFVVDQANNRVLVFNSN